MPPTPTETRDFSISSPRMAGKLGLVLSGGGARGAYQAGVLKAIAEIAHASNVVHPIPIITGVSAGAVNAAYLAATCRDFSDATHRLAQMWTEMTADRVFRTDALSAGRSGLRFLSDATIGALYKRKLARSLLQTDPLRTFLGKNIPFEQIAENVKSGALDSVALTAMNYTNATSITFVQAGSDAPMWARSRRKSEVAELNVDHVMASSAIPLFFPAVRVGHEHFGDGCLRNTAPLSPAIHLGANRLLVISVRRPDRHAAPITEEIEPSIARVLGVMLNALLLDAIDVDMERMSRINKTVDFVPLDQRTDLSLHKIDYLWIRPSQDIGALAGELFEKLPSVLKYLVRGLGSSKEASELTSYLLFDPEFCGRLVQMGYEDGLAHAEQIRLFI